MFFTKKYFEKSNVEKYLQMTKNHENYPAMNMQKLSNQLTVICTTHVECLLISMWCEKNVHVVPTSKEMDTFSKCVNST